MINYQNIAKAVALRAAQIEGGDANARDLAYEHGDVGEKMDGVEVPYSALKNDILAVEQELAEMVGNSNNAIYRNALAIVSANVAGNVVAGADIPTANASSIPFIGSFDSINDAVTGKPLTEMPLQWVLRRIENKNSFFKVPAFKYAFSGTKIYHTVANAVFRGCGWDYATQFAQFDALGTSPLPPALETLWICKVLGGLAQESWFVEESVFYSRLAAEKQNAIISGKYELLSMPQIGRKTASAEPVKD